MEKVALITEKKLSVKLIENRRCLEMFNGKTNGRFIRDSKASEKSKNN